MGIVPTAPVGLLAVLKTESFLKWYLETDTAPVLLSLVRVLLAIAVYGGG